MSASILAALFVHIERVPVHVLQLMDNDNEDWLPRLRSVRPEMVVQEIRRVLEASADPLRVAWFYNWLMSRQRICPWLLIRFVATTLPVDYCELLTNVANALQTITRRPMTVRARNVRGTCYVCLIYNDVNPQYGGSGVMFLVLWQGQRFAAAYAETNVELRALTTALRVALSAESVELLLGHYGDLDAVLWAGLHDAGDTFLFRSDSSTSDMAQLFWHFDEPE
ncbi:hypothetical protein MTO96_025545 [Rhipicephalus appendiculatus]